MLKNSRVFALSLRAFLMAIFCTFSIALFFIFLPSRLDNADQYLIGYNPGTIAINYYTSVSMYTYTQVIIAFTVLYVLVGVFSRLCLFQASKPQCTPDLLLCCRVAELCDCVSHLFTYLLTDKGADWCGQRNCGNNATD